MPRINTRKMKSKPELVEAPGSGAEADDELVVVAAVKKKSTTSPAPIVVTATVSQTICILVIRKCAATRGDQCLESMRVRNAACMRCRTQHKAPFYSPRELPQYFSFNNTYNTRTSWHGVLLA